MAHHREDVSVFAGNDFGEKFSFTVGSSYIVGCILGLGRGFYVGWPKSRRMPRKLIANNLINALGKQSSRYGNAFAAAGLMYYLVGGTLNLLFQDELKDLPHYQRNMICGALSGGLYKSTKGVVGFGVGGVLGAAIMLVLTKLTEYGNEKGYVAFQMKF